MTRTSTGPLADSSCIPSCSCSAVLRDGAASSGSGTGGLAAESGVHSRIALNGSLYPVCSIRVGISRNERRPDRLSLFRSEVYLRTNAVPVRVDREILPCGAGLIDATSKSGRGGVVCDSGTASRGTGPTRTDCPCAAPDSKTIPTHVTERQRKTIANAFNFNLPLSFGSLY
jgi:hypothetical protein